MFDLHKIFIDGEPNNHNKAITGDILGLGSIDSPLAKLASKAIIEISDNYNVKINSAIANLIAIACASTSQFLSPRHASCYVLLVGQPRSGKSIYHALATPYEQHASAVMEHAARIADYRNLVRKYENKTTKKEASLFEFLKKMNVREAPSITQSTPTTQMLYVTTATRKAIVQNLYSGLPNCFLYTPEAFFVDGSQDTSTSKDFLSFLNAAYDGKISETAIKNQGENDYKITPTYQGRLSILAETQPGQIAPNGVPSKIFIDMTSKGTTRRFMFFGVPSQDPQDNFVQKSTKPVTRGEAFVEWSNAAYEAIEDLIGATGHEQSESAKNLRERLDNPLNIVLHPDAQESFFKIQKSCHEIRKHAKEQISTYLDAYEDGVLRVATTMAVFFQHKKAIATHNAQQKDFTLDRCYIELASNFILWGLNDFLWHPSLNFHKILCSSAPAIPFADRPAALLEKCKKHFFSKENKSKSGKPRPMNRRAIAQITRSASMTDTIINDGIDMGEIRKVEKSESRNNKKTGRPCTMYIFTRNK